MSTEAIHFDQQLVESVGSFIVASSETLASFSADCIYLIYENDSWGLLFGIFEEISDSVSSHSCVELHKLAAAD